LSFVGHHLPDSESAFLVADFAVAAERLRILVLRPAELLRKSISALKEWRYEPATCNGKPVEVETVLQVNYSLSR
jgi:hypothetical protein